MDFASKIHPIQAEVKAAPQPRLRPGRCLLQLSVVVLGDSDWESSWLHYGSIDSGKWLPLNLFRSRGLNELVASLTKRKAAAPRKLLGGTYSMNSVPSHLRMSCTCWHDQDIWNRREDTYAVEDPVRQVGRCTSDVSFFDASCRSKPVLKCSWWLVNHLLFVVIHFLSGGPGWGAKYPPGDTSTTDCLEWRREKVGEKGLHCLGSQLGTYWKGAFRSLLPLSSQAP